MKISNHAWILFAGIYDMTFIFVLFNLYFIVDFFLLILTEIEGYLRTTQ